MLDNDDTTTGTTDDNGDDTRGPQDSGAGAQPAQPDQKPVKKTAARRTAAKKSADAPAKKTAAKRTTKRAAKSAEPVPEASEPAPEASEPAPDNAAEPAAEKPKKKAPARKRAAAKTAAAPAVETAPVDVPTSPDSEDSVPAAPMVLFKAPETKPAPARKRTARKVAAKRMVVEEPIEELDATTDTADEEPTPVAESGADAAAAVETAETPGDSEEALEENAEEDDVEDEDADDDTDDDTDEDTDTEGGAGEGGPRRRRRRGGRRRRKPSDGAGNGAGNAADNGQDKSGAQDAEADVDGSTDEAESDESGDSEGGGESNGSRRRRRRRRSDGEGSEGEGSERGGERGGSERGGNRARAARNPEDEITSIGGSTRLEAKKQRRREGREAGRRRAPIVSEAEFLARREAVDRVMVIRQRDDLTQIGVLEDKVLVEHYVARESQTSLIGNVYLGRVQNVLPSMEAAFIDIGKGRNAVLYAGEVNWAALGHKDGQQRKIESVLSSGQTILVQVTKDPVGHKGARLTGQVSLPGRFLVYVPDGNTSGISRKLPDTERNRLKTLLKDIVPDTAGVIVRTAAEGASEDELTRDVERLTARWHDIEQKVEAGKGPELLYGEPDLTLKVVRDLFTEDFAKLVIEGDDAWDLVDGYVSHVAPDLRERLERFEPREDGKDIFAAYRVDEQIAKGLDRKVWLPSGGSLVIDRTEAMTVVDVNTGKFTGSGGNLEETVTKNNLEAAEEIVRQLRLRDIGGIIVIDFIDMVLESNRDLVLRRLVECLGRDRTRHQVAEVTSLGLVQMTRKRIGTGLLEAFSRDCDHCKGRGVVVQEQPVEPGGRVEDEEPRGRRARGGRGRTGAPRDDNSGNGRNGGGAPEQSAPAKPSPKDLAGTRPAEKVPEPSAEEDEAPNAPEEALEQAPESSAPSEAEATQAPEQTDVPAESAPSVAPAAAEPAEPVTAPEVPEVPEATEASVSPEATEVPQPPRVVTSSRRRTARRPAGPPPVVEAPVLTQPLPEAAGATGEDGAGHEGPTVVHVPIKRKGRKR